MVSENEGSRVFLGRPRDNALLAPSFLKFVAFI